MDLVTCVPKKLEGYNVVVVFMDCLTKMVLFAPMAISVTTPQLARIFVEQMFRNFGLSKQTVSDKDPRFIENFWKVLCQQIAPITNPSSID